MDAEAVTTHRTELTAWLGCDPQAIAHELLDDPSWQRQNAPANSALVEKVDALVEALTKVSDQFNRNATRKPVHFPEHFWDTDQLTRALQAQSIRPLPNRIHPWDQLSAAATLRAGELSELSLHLRGQRNQNIVLSIPLKLRALATHGL